MAKFLGVLLAICMLFALPGRLRAQAADLPESAHISGLVGHAQTYSLSCKFALGCGLGGLLGGEHPRAQVPGEPAALG